MNVYFALNINLTLQEEYIFNFVHSEQEEGWRLEGAAIVMQTSPFSAQQEHEGIITPSDRINNIE